MAIKTFEKVVKQISSDFKEMIETYDFKQYDFYSIKQTLEDHIIKNYPDYNNYFQSDFIMMLLDTFAFYGEMMAYKVDKSMNEAYLSTAKQRQNIIKIADMLGYNYSRMKPSYTILGINLTDAKYLNKIYLNDLTGTQITSIDFSLEASAMQNAYFPNKLDFLLKNISSTEFLEISKKIFEKLTDFEVNDGIKTKKYIEQDAEVFERSIMMPNIQTRIKPNENIVLQYMGMSELFELQNMKFDPIAYNISNNTTDAFVYDQSRLFDSIFDVSIEYVLKYNKAQQILDKNIIMYVAVVQGGSFTVDFTANSRKNYSYILEELNLFDDTIMIRQYSQKGELLNEFVQVDNINNTHLDYAFEAINMPNGFVELIFGDGKNTNTLQDNSISRIFYRKNKNNLDTVANFKNVDIKFIDLQAVYYDPIIREEKTVTLNFDIYKKISFDGGMPAESNEHIKSMARKLRSVQDRFVTASDYMYAGYLHPRVKYATAVLRSYIGKNSSRMSNEYLDVFFDADEQNIELIVTENAVYFLCPHAMFTESSIANKDDYIRFVETGKKYYFDIFDPESISPDMWNRYPIELLNVANKGKIIQLTQPFITLENNLDKTDIFNLFDVISVSDSSIANMDFISKDTLVISLSELDAKTMSRIISVIDTKKLEVIKKIEAEFSEFSLKINGFTYSKNVDTKNIIINLKIGTFEFEIPDSNKSFIWRHYKSDDIYLNPSKTNLIEIYVSGFDTDMVKNIEFYEPLSSSELRELALMIDEKKMLTDMVQVYNTKIYEVYIDLKIFKSKSFSIGYELLRQKIDNVIDRFFDIRNLSLGEHFHLSRLIEELHKNIPEIEYIVPNTDDVGKTITPMSTIDILNTTIEYTQIVEKSFIRDGIKLPFRTIILE